MQFSKLNNIVGWLVFLIAATTYTLTLEPTGSFWDCGEFVSAANKLQVVHPPGAPMFLLIARFFILFAGGNALKVAFWANFSSGICSAFTILFLFWTITHLAKKLMKDADGNLSQGNLIAVLGSGAVGALAYTFSDTFWFSAVEGEVYAMSSMFTALVVWAIFKWENVAHEPKSDRWLVFIAFCMGMSIGVHLLNLLTIPALAFVYYFKRYPVATRKGLIYTAMIGVGILGFVQAILIPGVVSMAANFDLFFVNTLGTPFNYGVIFWFIALIGGLVWGIRYSLQHGKVVLNTALLGIVAVLIGYSSYITIVIRAKADPDINMYQTNQIFNLLSYLNREQYGETPLMKGPYYTSKIVDQEEGATLYRQGENEYVETGKKMKYKYDKEYLFPRIYDGQQQSHVDFYKSWLNIKGNRTPSFADNINFFVSYQMGHMYWRYFMWNFAGRQNDIQGHGNITDGNWITGIKPIDAVRLGNQDKLPQTITENKANNKLYFLPFILGVLGLYFHFGKNSKDASIVAMLFFFTGLAIVLYLNQYPYQPRERDYAYVGSFYAFAIWIGLGVLMIYDFLAKKTSGVVAASSSTLLCLVAVPLLMANQEWNDHDRSNKYTARDLAHDYLNSCAKDAILFTYGDNDTYPLWYAQQVEGIRTDVRVINLSLLGMDWYINQMKKQTQEGQPVPFTLENSKYAANKRDGIPFFEVEGFKNGYADVKQVFNYITSDNQAEQMQTRDGSFTNVLPTKNLRFTVDKQAVLANNVVPASMDSLIVPEMQWSLRKNTLFKNDLMVMDLIANNNWKRPIYFTITMGLENLLGLERYTQLDGLCYRIVPIVADRNGPGQVGKINTDILYDNLMHKFKWGNMNTDIYVDPESSRMTVTLRNLFYQLAEQLIKEGKNDKALEVVKKCEEVMPKQTLPIDFDAFKFRIAQIYFSLGKLDEAKRLTDEVVKRVDNDLEYYGSLKPKQLTPFVDNIRQDIAIMQELGRSAALANDQAYAKTINTKAEGYFNKYQGMFQN